MKYLVRDTNHKSPYGDIFCQWWGHGKNCGGYVSDLRLAHRFTEDELSDIRGREEFISCSLLGISEEQADIERLNYNYSVLMEISVLARIKKQGEH